MVEGTALERRSGVSYRVPRTAKLTENSSIRAALPRARFGALLGHPIAFGSKIGSKLGMIESELANASPSIFNRRHGLDTDTCGPCRSGCNALVLGSLPVAMLARGRAALVRCHRRLGPGATTDCLRRALHCTVCGRKGGTITTVSALGLIFHRSPCRLTGFPRGPYFHPSTAATTDAIAAMIDRISRTT